MPDLRTLASYEGAARPPRDLAAFWAGRAAAAWSAREPILRPAGIETPVADYHVMELVSTDGMPLRARYVCPKGTGPLPTVVMTHDVISGPRGWHHLTRFVALGYAVCELERRSWSGDICAFWQRGPSELEFARLVDDMLVTAAAVRTLPRTDAGRLVAWGEGLAGGLAIDVAALAPDAFWKAAALNPMPADLRATWEAGGCELAYAGLREHFRWEDPTGERAGELFSALEYVDTVNIAGLLGCELLLGTSLMDTAALPASQFAIVSRAPVKVRHITYPKWAHERVNDFEDVLLEFLHV